MIPLRGYQLDAIERVRDELRAGACRVLVAAATGSGKTVLAAHIMVRAVESGKRVLFVAHRRELIDQCYRKLLASGLEERQVGVVMSGDPRRRPGASVHVASIDTLRNRAKPLADLVIVDEAHRALAKSYRDLASAYPKAIHLGLTATPYRADGKGLGDAYEALVVVASPRELIDQGFLVEPVVYTVPEAELPDLSSIRVRRGDYDEKALAAAVDRQPLVGNIVEHWQRRAEGVRTVAFAVSIEHSKHLAERFVAAGVPAEHLDGETPTDLREAILARLERGETRVVSNVGVLCEGWDQPSVKCCILARPTKSTGLYLQQAGRILRPWTDPATGKAPRALILDHAGCALEHGLPQDDRELSLLGATKKGRVGAEKRVSPTKTCEQCCAIVPAARRVCECGFSWAPELTAVPCETEAELVELTRSSVDEKRAEWDRLCAEAQDRGYKAGWVFYRYKERFGAAPPRSFPLPKTGLDPEAEAERRAYFRELTRLASERGYRRGYVFVRYRARYGVAPPAHFEEPDAARIDGEPANDTNDLFAANG